VGCFEQTGNETSGFVKGKGFLDKLMLLGGREVCCNDVMWKVAGCFILAVLDCLVLLLGITQAMMVGCNSFHCYYMQVFRFLKCVLFQHVQMRL
jgi:hypothetical protein